MLGVLLMEERQNLVVMGPAEWRLPPWIAFEDIEEDDMFWRMGRGEEWVYEWTQKYTAVEPATQQVYRHTFPDARGWEGFYE